MTRSLVVVAVLFAVSAPAQAQPVEALRTCLMDSTSGKDRKDLVKWIFFAMAAHPELKQYAAAGTVTAADEGSRRMGALVSRVGPTRASFITYLIPGVSLVLGVVFNGDHVAALAVLGVAFVIAGAMLAGRQERAGPAPARG